MLQQLVRDSANTAPKELSRTSADTLLGDDCYAQSGRPLKSPLFAITTFAQRQNRGAARHALFVPNPLSAPNVGAQPTGGIPRTISGDGASLCNSNRWVEVYRAASADGALLCLSNSPAVAAAVTPSAVTAVAAPIETDLHGAGLDLR